MCVEQAERGGIDHVLGIVHHDHSSCAPRPTLIFHERTIYPVEAIGLGARPIAPVNHQSQARVVLGGGKNGFDGVGIVPIATNVKPQVFVRPGSQSVADSRPDHRRFAPGCDEDGCLPSEGPMDLIVRNAASLGAPGNAQPQPDQVDR